MEDFIIQLKTKNERMADMIRHVKGDKECLALEGLGPIFMGSKLPAIGGRVGDPCKKWQAQVDKIFEAFKASTTMLIEFRIAHIEKEIASLQDLGGSSDANPAQIQAGKRKHVEQATRDAMKSIQESIARKKAKKASKAAAAIAPRRRYSVRDV